MFKFDSQGFTINEILIGLYLSYYYHFKVLFILCHFNKMPRKQPLTHEPEQRLRKALC